VILLRFARFAPFAVQAVRPLRRPILQVESSATEEGLRAVRFAGVPSLTKLVAAMSLVATALVGSVALASSASASPAGDLAAATNSARAHAGLAPLALNAQLTAVAQAWANHLAAANVLSHNGSLRAQVSNWSVLGENVGMAGDIPSVQAAFMASPAHRDNILNAKYTQMGVASASSTYPSCGCTVTWVVVDFRRPTSAEAVAAPAKPAAPVTTPAKKPAATTPAKTTSAKTTAANTTPAKAAVTKTTPAQQVVTVGSAAVNLGAKASATASATVLRTQLAASAQPNTTNPDPVGRMLSFASAVSQLPAS
jgi:uncharacterized protein YkwD